MEDDEAGLVRALIAKQSWAGEQLFRQYSPRLCRLIYVWTRNWHDAEDLRSETWIKVLRNLAHFEPARSSFHSWLVRQARDVYIAWVRRNGNGCLSLEEIGEDQAIYYRQSGSGSVRNHAFHEALKVLSPEEQDLLNLCFQSRWSAEEIAGWLGISQVALRQRKCRAEKKLLKRMKGMGVFRNLFEESPVEETLGIKREERSAQEVRLAVQVPAG